MSRSCHRCWKCNKPLTFCSLLARCRIPCACHAKPHLNLQKWSEHVVFFTFWLGHVLRATTACTFSTSQLPTVVRAFDLHFFDITTSKSGPSMVCFVHFELDTCVAPQWRALFRHLNFQKWSDPGVFCTFWLGNVLRATTACNFSSLIWPAGSAPAALASLLFDPPEPQIIETTHCFATFLFRAPGSSLFWDFLFFVVLSSSLLFPHSSHLCFPSVHIVGSLTSKLPSPTSSTAQGGGGSFKNRKPIGEVGCCDSGMAERSHWWTERCLRSPLFLSLSLTMYPPTYLPIYLCIYLSIDLSLSLSLSSNYLSIYLSIFLSLSSVYLSSSLSVYLSIDLSICGAVSVIQCNVV